MHVVTNPGPPWPAAGGALRVRLVPAAEDNLIWVLSSAQTGEAAVVDGPEAGAALAACEAAGLRVTTVLNTHTHGDHVGINHDLARRGRLAGLRVIGPAAVAADVPGITEPVDEGDRVVFAGVTGRVLRTDGHLNGHISFVFGDVLFCGDTLFTGGCGYLFDGPPAAMFDSLLRLAALDGATRVCCAHEYTLDNLRFAWSLEPDNAALLARIRRVRAVREAGGSAVPDTLETERATNPFLRPGSATLIASVRAAMPDADLSTPLAVFTATRRLKDRRDYKAVALPD